jgi:hypothetical protein
LRYYENSYQGDTVSTSTTVEEWKLIQPESGFATALEARRTGAVPDFRPKANESGRRGVSTLAAEDLICCRCLRTKSLLPGGVLNDL